MWGVRLCKMWKNNMASETKSHLRNWCCIYEDISKSDRTWSITKYTLTTINTYWEAIQMVMASKLTRLTHKIAIQLLLVAASCTICNSRSRRPVRKLLDTPSYISVEFGLETYSTGVRHRLSHGTGHRNVSVSLKINPVPAALLLGDHSSFFPTRSIFQYLFICVRSR